MAISRIFAASQVMFLAYVKKSILITILKFFTLNFRPKLVCPECDYTFRLKNVLPRFRLSHTGNFYAKLQISRMKSMHIRNRNKQAGVELGQAQSELGLEVEWKLRLIV